MPLGGFCVIRWPWLSLFIEQCSKDHAYRMTPRVAARITESADLFKLDSREAGLFAQLPGGGCFQRFVFVYKPARESPAPSKRFMFALDEQDSSVAIRAVEKDDVHSHCGPRMIVTVYSTRRRCFHQALP
jgi:hypothetical protein